MKSFESFRAARREVYKDFFSARSLCIAGLLVMPALVFNPLTQLRIIQFFFFWFLSWLSGKRNNPLFTFLVIVGIVAFNVIVPYGELIFSAGPLKITSGALMEGLRRAFTLEGLVMLSRVAIRRDLRFPGAFGEILSESLRIFAVITDDFKQKITRKNFMEDIDALMVELSAADPEAGRTRVYSTKTKAAGFVVLTLVVLLSWLPWAAVLFNLI